MIEAILPFMGLFLATFILTWGLLPGWIERAKKAGLVGRDIHKKTERKVAEMGGVIVLLGFMIGVVGYIAMRVFVLKANSNIAAILALLCAIFIAAIIGIIDDILGWKIGLRQWQKPLLTVLVAVPIMAINAGTRVMSLPFLGPTDLGLFYPLLIIPALIIISANGFNMMAGYNGLEAGQGVLILSVLAYLTYISGDGWLAVVSLCMVFALLGFLMFNYYPARIFPGDTLTYTVGSLIAIVAILGNHEKAFLILIVPYIIEFFLKLRGLFQKESFAEVQNDGTLRPRYTKVYGLEHVAVILFNKLKIRTTETKVVGLLHGFQLVFVALALVI